MTHADRTIKRQEILCLDISFEERHTHTHTHCYYANPRGFLDFNFKHLANPQREEKQYNSHLILTVLVLYSSTVSLILAQNETTYLRELPTGQKLLCNRCPPGYRLQKHCNETHQTLCRPCDEGLYTEVWDYIYECLPCRWCRSNQVEAVMQAYRIIKRQEILCLDISFEERHTHCYYANPRVLVLYSSTVSLILAENETMYLRELRTGQKLLCNRCPPGYHLQKHCTETHQTLCRPCDEGLYTEVWDYIYECLPCRWCRSNQVEVQTCTSSTNRVCGCKEGFYLDSDICRPHSVCPSGYRVKEKGTPLKDTVCEPCRNKRSADGHLVTWTRGQHTECKSDERLLLRGTKYLDNVCVNCSSIVRH
ncbi:hypothetical protein QTP86_016900, partial [Hemibagrus guttatus]